MKNNYFIIFLFSFCSVGISYAQVSVQDPHKPLISKATATWCNVCGADAWDNFHDLIEMYSDEAVFMAVHSDEESAFYSPTADSIANNFADFFGVPSLYLGREPVAFTLPWENAAEEYIAEFSGQNRLTQSSLTFEIRNNTIIVDASIQFVEAQADPHFYSVLLVEDGVTGFQLNRGPRAIHSKILRTHLTPNVFNNIISQGPIDANEKFDFNLTKELEDKWKKDKIEVVLVTWKKSGEQYQLVNTTDSKEAKIITSNVDLPVGFKTFEVSPNILAANSQILLHSDKEIKGATIAIYNSLGQLTKQIYRGDLQAGQHSYTISRSNFRGSGIYFVSLSSQGKTFSRRIVVN